VKVRGVTFSNHRRDFCVRVGGRVQRYSYARLEDPPEAGDSVVEAVPDPEIANEGFVYRTASCRTGTVHAEQVLDYNQDPRYLRDTLLYELTLAARARIADAGLSRREVARRLGTSPAQLYRLLDQTNKRKSMDRMLGLLAVLDLDVRMTVCPKAPRRRMRAPAAPA
jgi:hypothetical protein